MELANTAKKMLEMKEVVENSEKYIGIRAVIYDEEADGVRFIKDIGEFAFDEFSNGHFIKSGCKLAAHVRHFFDPHKDNEVVLEYIPDPNPKSNISDLCSKNDPLKKDFYFGCPNCPEPATTLEFGKHIKIHATATLCGTECRVGVVCTVCGAVKEITKEVEQSSFISFIDLFGRG